MADNKQAPVSAPAAVASRPGRTYVDVLTGAERQLQNAAKLAGTPEAHNRLRRMALEVAQARIAAEMVALGANGAS